MTEMQLKCLVGSYDSHLYGLNGDFELEFATSVHVGKVTSVAMRKNMFASAGNDESIKVYRQNKLLFTANMDGNVNEIEFSDIYLICTAGRFLVMYKKDELVQELRHMEDVLSFSVHPSNRFLLSLSSSHLYLFNLLTGKKMVREPLRKHLKATVYPISIKFDERGEYFYILTDRYLLVFQTEACQCIHIFASNQTITCISVSSTCYIGFENGLICEIDVANKTVSRISALDFRVKGLAATNEYIYAVDCNGLLKQFSYSVSDIKNDPNIPLSFYSGEMNFTVQSTEVEIAQFYSLDCRVTSFAIMQ